MGRELFAVAVRQAPGTQVYPWRLFRLIGGSITPADVLADAKAGFKQCVLDGFTQHFVRKYPTEEAMGSADAAAELQAIAMVSLPTTVKQERWHAGVKRAARVHEETHTQKLMHSSALRVLGKYRVDGATWFGRCASARFPDMHQPLHMHALGTAGPGPSQRARDQDPQGWMPWTLGPRGQVGGQASRADFLQHVGGLGPGL